MQVCGKCGAQMAAGTEFCGNCGSPMGGGYAAQGSAFTSFIAPYLKKFENGEVLRKGFWLLYVVQAVCCLIVPAAALIVLLVAIISGAPWYAFLLMLPITTACWLGFQVLWAASKKIKTLIKDGDEFVAIPLVAFSIKTGGDFYAIVLVGLLVWGVITVIPAVIIGYMIKLLADFFAESILALASIANNTKRIAK